MESQSINRAGGFWGVSATERQMRTWVRRRPSKRWQPASGEALYCWENLRCHSSFCRNRPPSLLLSCQHLIPLLSSFSHSSFCIPHRFFSLFFFLSPPASRFHRVFDATLSPDAVDVCFPTRSSMSFPPLRLHSRLKDYFTLLDIAVIKPYFLFYFTFLHFIQHGRRWKRAEPSPPSTPVWNKLFMFHPSFLLLSRDYGLEVLRKH